MEEQRKQNSRNKNPGGTVFDYVRWRGDLSFAESRWNEIDSVIAALISYANFGENELTFQNGQGLRLGSLASSDLLDRYPQDGIADGAEVRSRFLREMAESRRFQDIIIPDQVNDVDPARNIQFSAITMEVPDTGTVVAFRGTDTSLVGWKEDFMLCYMTPVPAQTAALAYLEQAAARTTGPIFLAGHSKGGNLALYSAAHTSPEIRDRIREIYSFDGPGLDDETVASENYRSIEPLIRSFVPTGSMIGMLLITIPFTALSRPKRFPSFSSMTRSTGWLWAAISWKRKALRTAPASWTVPLTNGSGNVRLSSVKSLSPRYSPCWTEKGAERTTAPTRWTRRTTAPGR